MARTSNEVDRAWRARRSIMSAHLLRTGTKLVEVIQVLVSDRLTVISPVLSSSGNNNESRSIVINNESCMKTASRSR